MKSNENRYLWTQIEIVKTLLDGSKKTQNQIAKETDYDKSTISHAMDDLDKNNIIKRQSKEKESGNRNKGRYKNKLCWLNFEMDNGSEILRFFNNILKSKKLKQQETSDIIKTLQKEDHILDMLSKKHPLLCFSFFSMPEVAAWWKKDKPDTNVEERIQKEVDDLKEKLMSSQTFFKICLMNDSETIVGIFTKMHEVFSTEYLFDEKKEKYVFPLRVRNIGYKLCVFMDFLDELSEPMVF